MLCHDVETFLGVFQKGKEGLFCNSQHLQRQAFPACAHANSPCLLLDRKVCALWDMHLLCGCKPHAEAAHTAQDCSRPIPQCPYNDWIGMGKTVHV